MSDQKLSIDVLNAEWILNLDVWRETTRAFEDESRALKRTRADGQLSCTDRGTAQARLDGRVRPALTALYVLRALGRRVTRQHLAKDAAQGLWLRARRWHVEQLPASLLTAVDDAGTGVSAACTDLPAPGAHELVNNGVAT